jgi:hypothetical protein
MRLVYYLPEQVEEAYQLALKEEEKLSRKQIQYPEDKSRYFRGKIQHDDNSSVGFLMEEKEVLQVKVQEKIIHTKEEHHIQKVNIFGLSVLNVMNMVIDLMNAQIFCMEIILIRLYKLKMKKV